MASKKRTEEKLVDKLMALTIECAQLSDFDDTVENVLEQNPDLYELRDKVLRRMSSTITPVKD